MNLICSFCVHIHIVTDYRFPHPGTVTLRMNDVVLFAQQHTRWFLHLSHPYSVFHEHTEQISSQSLAASVCDSKTVS